MTSASLVLGNGGAAVRAAPLVDVRSARDDTVAPLTLVFHGRPGATVIKWIGRLLLVGAPQVIFSAVLWPRGVQFLNRVVCPAGLHLDNRSSGPTSGPGEVELVCRDGGVVDNVTVKLVVLVGALLALSAAAYVAAQRARNQRVRAPSHLHGG